MDLQLLETFLDLAETKNFTMTAKRLKKSQAAISLQINRLEEMLGKFLFDRDNRNVNLSQDGEVLIGYAKQILNMHQELLYRFSSLPIEGTIKMGVPEDFASLYLSDALSSFAKQYPKIVLNIETNSSEHLLSNFKNNLYDLVILHQNPNQQEEDAILIKEDVVFFVKSRDYQPDLTKPISLILNSDSCFYNQMTIQAFESAGIAYRIAYTCPSLSGRIAALKAGFGITPILQSQLKKDFEVIDYPNLSKNLPIQFVLLKNKKITLAQEALSNHLVNHFEN